MSRENAIVVEHVTKEFRMRSARGGSLKALVMDTLKRRSAEARTLKALDDVSFAAVKGETLGLIGANGAGKSTLLGLITGTMQPTSGQITTRGAISSLLELGAGFHPDLTGRENIFLYGAIMGLTRQQMRARFDAIVAFAELEKFIDQPVKHYSSGMYVRLGFAVAVEVDPEILLIDEVLAVGDLAFQRKCLQKMRDFRKAGKTMLIISHDINTIQSISDRILMLDSGKVIGLGDPAEIARSYQNLSRQKVANVMGREWGTGEVRIVGVEFRNDRNEKTDAFRWGESLSAKIHYEAVRRIDNPVFGFSLADKEGRVVYGNNTQIEGFRIDHVEGAGSLSLRLDQLAMATGTYLFSFSVHSADHTQNYHRLDHRFPITIDCPKNFEGPCYMPSAWRLS